MAAKKRGLGRGLDALLGEVQVNQSDSQALQMLPIEYLLVGRFQPRKEIDPARLQELADSISAQGIVQPIIVRKVGDDQYEIIAGERRWRAAQLAGLHEIPVVRRDVNDQVAMALGLIENIQREDLNPLEEAEALQRLCKEFNMTHQQAADAVGKSRTAVTNLLRLIDLHPDVKQLLAAGEIEMGHARALLGLDESRQSAAAQIVLVRGLTVRATEKLVQALLSGKKEKPEERRPDPDIERLQTNVSEKLGARVQIRHSKNGSGRLVISYSSLEQLEGVLERIQ
jgi:ParB family transcriptional regulator, chromosome partitioning protein